MRRPIHPLSIIFLLAVATMFWSSVGDPDFTRFPSLAFLWSHRWLSAAAVVAVVAHVLIQRRHACSGCGKRGFTRVVWCGADSDAANEPLYSMRYCRTYGIRQVDCDRGVERLPADRWDEPRSTMRGEKATCYHRSAAAAIMIVAAPGCHFWVRSPSELSSQDRNAIVR